MTYLKIGHRGCLALEPENTMRSFRRAIKIGVDYIEMDVHLSADNHLVVIHDKEIDRTTDGKGKVREMEYIDLQKLDAGKKEQVPALRRVFLELKGKVKFVIELKAEHTPRPLVELLHELEMVEEVIVISFFHEMVKDVKRLDKRIMTGVVFSGCPIHPSQLAKDADADWLFAGDHYLDKGMVEESHAAGLKVASWSLVDDKEELHKLEGWGTDAISADDPNIFYG